MSHFSDTVIGDKKAQFTRAASVRKTITAASSQLLQAYRNGYFVLEQDNILYACSSAWREIIPLNPVALEDMPHDVRRIVRRRQFQTSTNCAFRVIAKACARRHLHSSDRWIGDRMLELIDDLYQQGYAHSLEVWSGTELAAGTLGLQIGAAYIGLSSFHNPKYKGAGNAAAFALRARLQQAGFLFFDSISPSAISQLLGGRLMRSTDVWPKRQKAVTNDVAFPQGTVWIGPELFPSRRADNQKGRPPQCPSLT